MSRPEARAWRASRIVAASGAREVLTLPAEGVVAGGMAIAGGRLHFVAERDGAYEIRTDAH